jgi:hypothetical protein
MTTPATAQAYPAAAGDLFRIGFTHSIYGSSVEETFRIVPGGFATVDVRYAEPRLVAFYGYESATRVGDWWVAHPPKRVFPSFVLEASPDAHLYISFGRYTILVKDGPARVASAPCSRPHGG